MDCSFLSLTSSKLTPFSRVRLSQIGSSLDPQLLRSAIRATTSQPAIDGCIACEHKTNQVGHRSSSTVTMKIFGIATGSRAPILAVVGLLVAAVKTASGFILPGRGGRISPPRSGGGSGSASPSTSVAFAPTSSPEVVTEREDWTKKRLHNTQAFRSAALLGALVAAGMSSSVGGRIPNASAAAVHVLSFGTWFGSVAYTTFVAGITMFTNLPRQTFGKLQSKLFPKYFSLCSIALVLQV